MVLPTIPISFLRTVRIKEGRRSTNLADTLDPNPITSNSHITDSISPYQSRRLLSHHSKVNRHYRFHQLLPISPTTIPSFQSQPTNTDSHHKKLRDNLLLIF